VLAFFSFEFSMSNVTLYCPNEKTKNISLLDISLLATDRFLLATISAFFIVMS